jgi:hypothetical protein
VIDACGRIPLTEYEAFESPSEAAARLIVFLSEASRTYRSTCTSYESTESFWLAFFRRGPAPELCRPGCWLWNLRRLGGLAGLLVAASGLQFIDGSYGIRDSRR